ncbi:hypothetical protein L3X38_041782 [Prunus dulcis]|uniref:Uncharacterized protein n=1 Tax=Prunus dulcis TaxID=3755 RepID=A0AAD4YKZ1_PRUDU|nr:hypothetical protein L3X38_041782 [Prunus dulcis]
MEKPTGGSAIRPTLSNPSSCDGTAKFPTGLETMYWSNKSAFFELQLLLLGRDRSGYSRWSDELGIILRELFCLNRALPEFSGVSTFVKTQTLLVLAFAEPNL